MSTNLWLKVVRAGLTALVAFFTAGLAHSEDVRAVNIVAFGASQTEGKIVSRDQAYPAQLERLLQSASLKVNVANAGVSGDNSSDLLQRVDSDIPGNTDLVLFQPGTNDCNRKRGTSESVFRSNMSAILGKFKERRLAVLVLGGACYEELQAEMPAAYGFKYYGRMTQGMKDYPKPDGQHYTAEGYARMVELLAPLVKQLIQEIPQK